MHTLHHALASGENAGVVEDGPAHGGSGYAQVVALARNGHQSMTPARVAAVIEQHPHEQALIMEFLHQRVGNGFVQQLIAAISHAQKESASVTEPGHADTHERNGRHNNHDDGSSDDGQIHIITDAGLRHLRQAGPAGVRAAKELYDNPHAYIVLRSGLHMPDGWKGHATLLYPSYAAFEQAANSGVIGKGIDAVIYDNEHWEQTPEIEKRNASEYAKKFERLAHHLGLTFIAAPTRKFFAGDARYADIVDVQLQDREAHTKSYAKALDHDVKVAHHENPDVKVVCQITSSVRHLDPTHTGRGHEGIRKAEHDVVANAPNVDGFWGYVYQQNPASIHAGTTILEDLAEKKRKGAKI
jgi:hypothetical protein